MQSKFSDILEAVEELPIDEKEMLVDIVQNRLREDKRRRIVKSVKEAQREFEKGNLKPSSVDDIMKEILS
ncbi:MAG TPA: hypothetical protein VK400_06870 [Pyrinomonadaceae bacterium]|nr:hypothetical protein [Pyrinomonadaceae bacterium]